MGFFDFMKKKEVNEQKKEEYVDMNPEEKPVEQVKILVDKLEGFASCDNIIRNVRSGHIVVAKIKDLKESNMDELKQCISKLSNFVKSIEGDIAGVGDDWIILTPKVACVVRNTQQPI